MKTITQLTNCLDEQSKTRKRELTTALASATRTSVGAPEAAYLLRAAYCIIYSHFEGFTIFAAKAFLEHVEKQGHAFARLSVHLKVNALHSRLRGLEKSDRFWQYREVVEILLGKKPCQITDSMIDAQGNLSYATLVDMLSCCGVDASAFVTKETFIDKVLLQMRNDIAHGKLVPVSLQELKEAKDFVHFAIDEETRLFQNSALMKEYLN